MHDRLLKGHTVFGYWRKHCTRHVIRGIKIICLHFYDEVKYYEMIGRNHSVVRHLLDDRRKSHNDRENVQSNQRRITHWARSVPRMKYSPQITFSLAFLIREEDEFLHFAVRAWFNQTDIKRLCYRVTFVLPELQMKRNYTLVDRKADEKQSMQLIAPFRKLLALKRLSFILLVDIEWIEYESSPLLRLSPIHTFQKEWSYENRVEKSNGIWHDLTFCMGDWEFRIASTVPPTYNVPGPALHLVLLRRSTVIKKLTYDIALRTKTNDFEDGRLYSVSLSVDGSVCHPPSRWFPIPGWNTNDWLDFKIMARITSVEDQNGKIFEISQDLKDQTQSLKYCQLLDFFSSKHLHLFCGHLFSSWLIAIVVFWLSSPMITVCVTTFVQFVAFWCICHWYLGWDCPLRDLMDVFFVNVSKVCDWFNDCPSQLH